jgi:F-type H+-transporting ATPase subunit gamma
MTRLAEIENHIASMNELLDIVGALRSLAGMRVQEAQRALTGVRRYARSMAGAIGSALLLLPPSTVEKFRSGQQRAVVLYAAEHGFVAGFNGRLIEAAESAIEGSALLFLLGSRGAALAAERGWQPVWAGPMASRSVGVPDTVRRLTAELYARLATGEISHVEAVFTRYRQGAVPSIERRRLLPVDLGSFVIEPPTEPPLHNLPPQMLIEKLVSEYVFALLAEAAVESIASENAARLAAMESARDNVSKKLEQLRQWENQTRQNEVTTELLDLVSGAEALAIS